MKVSQIKTVKCYADTLREFSVGQTKYYKIVDTDYAAFHNARRRLHEKKAGKFIFGRHEENGKKYFVITRVE